MCVDQHTAGQGNKKLVHGILPLLCPTNKKTYPLAPFWSISLSHAEWQRFSFAALVLPPAGLWCHDWSSRGLPNQVRRPPILPSLGGLLGLMVGSLIDIIHLNRRDPNKHIRSRTYQKSSYDVKSVAAIWREIAAVWSEMPRFVSPDFLSKNDHNI